ncbi:AAA family ATPase [Frondihabitans peucedani]|uniref:AAA family ATPase n=1 Tax=Frondihabitans peucedani TaxID=598626 RepID=A0ABP8E1T1_9MICO
MNATNDWRIDNLEVSNFRCFEQFAIDFHPALTVLVGVNGAGKTAVLDCLAIMLSTVLRQFDGPTRGFTLGDAREVPYDLRSKDGLARMEPQFPVSAKVNATLAGEATWWLRVRQSAGGRTSWADRNTHVGAVSTRVWQQSELGQPSAPLLPVIALYGVERLLGVRKAAGTISKSRSGAYAAALEGKSDLARLSAYIKALTLTEFVADRRGENADAASNQLEAISLACNQVLEGTGWSNPEWSPLVEELTLQHQTRGTLPLSFLSSGIKIAVGLVIDLVSRIARANPRTGANSLLRQAPGIVLIDEVDLHLHPTWQQRILPQLREVFPGLQFIVTTHSPQVLSTVPAQNIRVIDGSSVRLVDFSAGLRSDIVMDKVLGTSPEPDLPINKRLDDYMSLVAAGKGESPEASALRDKLEDELGGVRNVPKLAEADAEIAFYDLEG